MIPNETTRPIGLGGRARVIETAATGATPTPGNYADDGY